MYGQPLCLLLCGTFRKFTVTPNAIIEYIYAANQEIHGIATVSSLHYLKMLPAQHLEIFPTDCPMDSNTICSTASFCFSFIFIETLLIKCLTLCTIKQITSNAKYQ